MKKCISLLLTVLLLAACAAVPARAAEDAAFVPVLRFIAASDSHVRAENDVTADRIGRMLRQTYALADSGETYQNLDALVMAGDLTNNGTPEEFDKFWAAVSSEKRDGTQFLGVVAKNHDGWTMNRKDMRAYYTALTGEAPDFHRVINGFHFIGLSAAEDDSVHYSDAQLKWLKAQLDAAVADAPGRPVFFIHHEHNRNTVYGSSTFDGWGITPFRRILRQYPQVVDFSGHSHYPLNDPRSIWQGRYTAIGTGALAYSEFTIDDVRAYDPPDCEQTATYWIVEVNAAGDLHLCGMDAVAGVRLCEYQIANPADKANRDYTPLKQRAASRPPVFDDSTAIKTEVTEPGTVRITVPAAQSTDRTPVVLYRLTVRNALGAVVNRQWVLPAYDRADPPKTVAFAQDGLAKGTYTFLVTAETAYGVRSKALRATVTLDDGADGVKAFVNTLLRPLRRAAEFLWNRLIGRYLIRR